MNHFEYFIVQICGNQFGATTRPPFFHALRHSKNSTKRAWPFGPSAIIKDLHVKLKRGIGRNPWRSSVSAISVLWRTRYNSPLPLLHLLDALVPAPDDHADAESECEGALSAPRAVEYSSIHQPTRIVHRNF